MIVSVKILFRNEKMKESIDLQRFSVGLTAALLRGSWSNPKGKNLLFGVKERLSGFLGYDHFYQDILQEREYEGID
jgi:hypothetical protein